MPILSNFFTGGSGGADGGGGLTLNDYSWDGISRIAASGKAANYFAIGDRKAVAVSGTVGTQSISGTYYVYIIGFAHNGATNTIDFGTFKKALSGGTDICLIDNRYDNDGTDKIKYFNMNHSSTTLSNSGGWKGCDLRYDVLGSTNVNDGDATTTTATKPVSETLMAALPYELRAVMKPMTIYTDNTGGGTDTASNVTSSVDYLPLLAVFEIFGVTTRANSAEENYQAQYAYYSAGNSKKKYRYNATYAGARYWMRSPDCTTASMFCAVGAEGFTTNGIVRYSYGLAPIFRI